MADTNKFLSIPQKTLKTDITSSATSFKLRDILWYTGSDGADVNLSASDFGTTGWGVFEPRTAREEYFTWDTSTIANYATTGITINLRGLIRTSPYTTESSTRKFAHPSGSTVLLFTNAPGFYDSFANKGNDETITGLWQFPTGASYPVVGASYSAPTADTQVATKKYVDDVAIAGAPDATTSVKGLVEIATAAEIGAGTGTGGTGATVVVAASSCAKTSSGASDENKVPVLDSSGTLANGFIDKARTWGTVQSFTANNAQITTDPDSANDAVRLSYLQGTYIPTADLFGSGSDGAVTISSNTTLTRDMYYTTLVVDNGFTLTTAGFKVFATTSITNNGTISNAGASATATATGAAGGAAGTLGGGTAGGNGAAGGTGAAGTTGNACLGSAGGAGGGGSSTSGGAGGTRNAAQTLPRALVPAMMMLDHASTVRILSGGTGGGGGGGNGADSGGGGGGGGGVVWLASPTITNAGTITAAGGNGSNKVGTDAGGGGGGGGGSVVKIYKTLSESGLTTVAGGTAGSGVQAATNGTAGASYNIDLS